MGDLATRIGGAVARGRRAFARWRWTRPFWGGLLLILAGLELFATTQGGADINGLSVQMGPSGYLSWLIPAVLVTCGLLIWFSPGQRVFYAVIGAVTSVFSLMAVNLGGFFIGLLLGATGSALAFGWTPPAAPEPELEPETETETEPGEELTGPKAEGYAEPGPRARRTPWWSMWILIFVAALGVFPGARVAHAGPCPSPSPGGSPSPSASRPPGPIEGIVEGITGGLGDLLGIGGDPDLPAAPPPSPSPSPSPPGSCGGPQPPPSGGDPAPGPPGQPGKPGGGSSPQPQPHKPGEDAGNQVKQLGVPPGVPPVAMRPSILTGSKVEMWNLGMDGIVDMPRADGSTIKALQFSMTKAYTHDFTLDTPRHQAYSPITSSRLDVEGDVKFYATRFTGRLLGIPITLTPASPIPPDGIPIALPYIAFDDPSMELLLATCDTLTGPDLVDTV